MKSDNENNNTTKVQKKTQNHLNHIFEVTRLPEYLMKKSNIDLIITKNIKNCGPHKYNNMILYLKLDFRNHKINRNLQKEDNCEKLFYIR